MNEITYCSKVIILRALPDGLDSRVLRWGDIYKNHNKVYLTGGGANSILNYRPPSGSIFIALWYILFSIMCLIKLMSVTKKNDIVIFVDLETILFGYFAVKLKGGRIHFDIADPFGLTKPVPFELFWKTLERFYISISNIVTVPHINRAFYYFNKAPNNLHVLENVPIGLDSNINQFNPGRFQHKGGVITLGYFGTLDEHRGLEDLIELVRRNKKLRFIIGGRGLLADYVNAAMLTCNRIVFIGAFKHEGLLELVKDVDVYCSLYYKSKKLHAMAAPNKYFEHLLFGIPILISSGVVYADDVLANQTGWLVDDGLENLQFWCNHIEKSGSEIKLFSTNAMQLWRDKYSMWLERQVERFASY